MVEDEKKQASSLKRGLGNRDSQSMQRSRGTMGLRTVSETDYGAIVVDPMLPG